MLENALGNHLKGSPGGGNLRQTPHDSSSSRAQESQSLAADRPPFLNEKLRFCGNSSRLRKGVGGMSSLHGDDAGAGDLDGMVSRLVGPLLCRSNDLPR